jgi:FKBP-type peptidyl-prolyl cis-trans isomerase
MRQEMQREADQNLALSKDFFDHNRTEQGVIETASGLQYKVLQSGSGAKPAAEDSVTVHYTGTLIDGTEFDSSRRSGEPVTFVTANVIPGWQEVLSLMHAGDHWQVFVPSELAYGERGAGSAIGPNQALIFDIELLQVEAATSED